MHYTQVVGVLAFVIALVASFPTAGQHSSHTISGHVVKKRASICTFTEVSAIVKSIHACETAVLTNIAVPAGMTLDLTNAADNTHIIFEGTTTFGYKEWQGPLIKVAGKGITISGSNGHTIDGDGARWWDGHGGNGGLTKPKFFRATNLLSSNITGLNIKNTPVQCFSIYGARDLHIDSVRVDNSAGDAKGHNTDAFDIGTSTGVTISNAVVYNQDDCLAVNSGSDITFTRGLCSGGHGLSIGSVGGRADNVVANVHISNSKIVNSANGIRIKTVSGATGSVKNVTYSNIELSGISKYGIVIEQDYENGGPTGKPTPGVPITDLKIDHVYGNVHSDAKGAYVLCAQGGCSDWSWTNISVDGAKVNSKCANVPSGTVC